MRYLPTDTARVSRQIDLLGVALLSASLLLVVLPLSVGQSQGWPAWAWACLAASVPTFAVFLAAQRRIADRDGSPLVNVRILAARPVFCALATLLTGTGTYYAPLFTLAQYLQQGLGHSALVSGLTSSPGSPRSASPDRSSGVSPADWSHEPPQLGACCSPAPTRRSAWRCSPATTTKRCSSCC